MAFSALAAGSLLLAGCAAASDADTGDAEASAAVEVAGIEITVDADAAALLPDDIAEAGSVKVATDAPYAPFEMFVEEGSDELTGVDVDLGHAIGAKLGIDFDAEHPVDPLHGYLQVAVAKSGEDGLTRLGAALDAHRGVLIEDLVQCGGKLLLILM